MCREREGERESADGLSHLTTLNRDRWPVFYFRFSVTAGISAGKHLSQN